MPEAMVMIAMAESSTPCPMPEDAASATTETGSSPR